MADTSAGPTSTSRLGRVLRHFNALVILTVVAAATGLLVSPSADDILLEIPQLERGDLAPRTIRSPGPFEVRDAELESRLRQQAAEGVLPTWDLDLGPGVQAQERVAAAFATVEGAPSGFDGRSQDFMRSLQVYLDAKELETLAAGGLDDSLEDAAAMVSRVLYEGWIVEDKALLQVQASRGFKVRVLDPDGAVKRVETLRSFDRVRGLEEARAGVDAIVADKLGYLTPAARRAAALIGKRLLQPNLQYNAAVVRQQREAASRDVKPPTINFGPGAVVLQKGQPVTGRQLRVLEQIRAQLAARSRVRSRLVPAAVFILLVVITMVFRRSAGRPFLLETRELSLAALAYVATVVLLWMTYKAALWASVAFPLFGVRTYQFVAPLSFGTLLLRFVLGRREAGALLPIVAVMAGWTMDSSMPYAVYAMVGGLAAATFSTAEGPRGRLLAAGFWCGVWQGAVALLLTSYDAPLQLIHLGDAAAALASGLLSALLVWLTVPVVEVMFGYTTHLKLSVLGNLNHPLLRELLVQAKDSYHHCIVVGALAEAAARVTLADPLLARVGGYYHDVGKLKNPTVYRENQRDHFGHEPPEEQALELKEHIAHGLEVGARYRLGRPILDIIEQHHGTSRVRQPELRALEMTSGSMPPVDMSVFRHAGPKPATREAGLVMLADAVESAVSRSIEEVPLEDRALEDIVGRVIDEIAAEGQLDESGLAFGDLRPIRVAFVGVLREMLLRTDRPRPADWGRGQPMVVRPPFDPRPN